MAFYTGIGSRETPPGVQVFMTELATKLQARGLVLRSGGAQGADTAFEAGVTRGDMKEIYLPWSRFNGHPSTRFNIRHAALDLAERHHPNWAACGFHAKLLHARNGYQVLGEDLQTPSLFVVCWTPLGAGRGGTGQAIRIAQAHNIPVFDIGAFSQRYVEAKITWILDGGIF